MNRKPYYIFAQLMACLTMYVCMPLAIDAQPAPSHRDGAVQSMEKKMVPSKLSHNLRQMIYQKGAEVQTRASRKLSEEEILALVKCNRESLLEEEGCQKIRNWGDIYAVSLTLSKIQELTKHKEIQRIEMGKTCDVCVDTTATLLGVNLLWKGIENRTGLTGKGVVMGIQDIGFDLTHPTFYSRDLKEYRIKAFWDMLDPDSLGSSLYVGRDYTTKNEILNKAVATDGMKQTHGVHTAGIAAGSGYDSPYVGMAPEADLCLVANAVSNDEEFISEENKKKYTATTDILGFQYIFDYADQVGKPCVISFSEGAHEDLYGDSQLLYEVIERMTGPGRIIVASAGNSSANKTYLHKPVGQDSISSFVYSNSEGAYYTLRHTDKTDISLHFSKTSAPGNVLETITVNTDEICACEDSLLIDTLLIDDEQFLLLLASYPSCYNDKDWATELYIKTLTNKYLGNGGTHRVRLTLKGEDHEVECFASGGLFLDISSMPQYKNAVSTHNINFPAACTSVIAVGGTAYRTGAHNYYGKWKSYDMGDDGRRWIYSSVGPTMQGNIKPDVMAPACNIVSAYSSYYIEQNPLANDVSWDVSHFPFNGRTYAWNCNSGTSMSAPVVGGIVALWLQLCPTLSPQDILQVIQATSRRYDPLLPYPNNEYGWGEINAMEGARYILSHFDCPDSIKQMVDEHTNGEKSGKWQKYDLNGRLVNGNRTHEPYLLKYENGRTRKFIQHTH